MADITWSKELHYITADAIKPSEYDADALRALLKSMAIIFRNQKTLLEKIRFICGDKKSYSTLNNLQTIARCGHEKLKSFLPHQQSDKVLFRVAVEMEGFLRYITAEAIRELEQRKAPSYLKNEVIDIETQLNFHCEHALKAMTTTRMSSAKVPIVFCHPEPQAKDLVT